MHVDSPGASRIPKNHIQVQRGKENFVVVCLSLPEKREIWYFSFTS